MLTIRFTRKGKKNQPFFRIVVVDKRRSSKGGRSVEEIGYFDPLTKKRSIKKERVLYWISKGAQPSATIHNLLVSEKIINAKKIAKHKASKKPAAAEAAASQAPATETPAPKVEEASKPVATPEAGGPRPEAGREEKKEEKPKEEKAV